MDFAAIYQEALEAAKKAAEAAVPTPVGFYSADLEDNPLSDVTVETEGLCGCAWVKIKGNTAFARWGKKAHSWEFRSGVYGGIELSVSEATRSQSIERKEKAAEAFAAVLRANGISCSVQSRLV
jgi:hypothetical protein